MEFLHGIQHTDGMPRGQAEWCTAGFDPITKLVGDDELAICVLIRTTAGVEGLGGAGGAGGRWGNQA